MKIAYIGIKGLPAQAGADRVVEAILRRLAKRHQITVYCSGQSIAPETTFPDVRLISLPGLKGKFTHMASVDFLAACHAVLFGDYDLVHLHNIEAGFTLPILKLRYKVVSTAHGRFTASNKWGKLSLTILQAMERPYVFLSDACTSVSAHDAQYLSQKYHRAVTHIPNGAEIAPQFDEEAARTLLRAHHLPEKGFLLCVAGRIIPLKGIHLVLEALRQIDRDIRLVIVGDLSHAPEYGAKLKALADDRVTFLPFMTSSSLLFGLYRLSELFVFPSTLEAMSVTLLEAASVGAPILCADIPANMAILPAQALYFSNGEVNSLAEKLCWALDHPKEMQRLGELAQVRLHEEFSWDPIADKYDILYRQVVGHD